MYNIYDIYIYIYMHVLCNYRFTTVRCMNSYQAGQHAYIHQHNVTHISIYVYIYIYIHTTYVIRIYNVRRIRESYIIRIL